MDLKAAIKGKLHEMQRGYERHAHAFGNDELMAGLRRVGVRAGDVLLVHSAHDAFTGYAGKATDLITLLQQAVGPEGTLMMPTISFTGTAVEHARTASVFDVRRTAAKVGLLPELFRRMPGVLRSLHPTHSVAAWGARAGEMVKEHELEETPCGPGSPYGKLLAAGGKSVFLGVTMDSMTFFHAIEAWLEPRMPFSPFTSEWFELQCRDAQGELHLVRTRLYAPAVSRRRRLGALKSELIALGKWHETKVAKLPVTCVAAADALQAAENLADRGVFCYEQ